MTIMENAGSRMPEEVAAKWEARLAKEGMAAEIEEDKAKKALEEKLDASEVDGKELDVRQALRAYWTFRSPQSHGEHLKIAQEIANKVGTDAGSIDQEMIDEVGREIYEAELFASETVSAVLDSLSGQPPNFKRIQNTTVRKIREKYPDFDPTVLDGVVERVIENRMN